MHCIGIVAIMSTLWNQLRFVYLLTFLLHMIQWSIIISTFYFYNNFGKCEPILIIVSLSNSHADELHKKLE